MFSACLAGKIAYEAENVKKMCLGCQGEAFIKMSKKCQKNVGYDLCLSDTSLPDVLARRQTNTKHIACLYATQAYSF